MALREVLTHQGSSAGVFSPDLSSESFLLVGSDEKNCIDSIKGGGYIDLNVQFDVDQHEPASKRPRTCEESVLPTSIPSIDMGATHSADIKVDDVSCNSNPAFVNGGLGIAHIKAEQDLFTDGSSPRCKIEDAVPLESSIDYRCSIPDMNFPVNLPQNPKLMKLITLARHSWSQNWDFLQDCAIRFLCILSLDRYVNHLPNVNMLSLFKMFS